MSTLFLVTYEDGSQEIVRKDAAFGLDGVAAHGPVVRATIAPTNTFADRDPEGTGFPSHTRLSRSLAR